MGEFLQNYGIWIALIVGMFLMHRLGLGCGAGHAHRRNGEGSAEGEAEPKEAKAAAEERPKADGSRPPGRAECH